LAHPDTSTRTAWNSKLGFILAASGAAIGLGNLVFFSANAYQYGGGAFYLPYLIGLFLIGIPVMILEFGLGSYTQRSFPRALFNLTGKRGEFFGWWSAGCALFISMYYITILGWGAGMFVSSFTGLFQPGATAPFAGMHQPAAGVNAKIFFFHLVATWWPVLGVVVVWGLNLITLWRGTDSIEWAVRIALPLMWIFMVILIIRGLTLNGGISGMMYLFTPNFKGIMDPAVWKGAFAQILFTLSLGLGVMTTYASYLPKNSDTTNNSILVSTLNCGFGFLAGIAIFSMLFAFRINPSGGTSLSLSFFAIPKGISEFPAATQLFGGLFFLLFLIAGITSSISFIEMIVASVGDKLNVSRKKALLLIAIPGILGSVCFALPMVIDPGLTGDGTLGQTLLDLLNHWAFSYTLLLVGTTECILIGWVFGIDKLRVYINKNSSLTLGIWFNYLIKYVSPALLALILVWNLVNEFSSPLYGSNYSIHGWSWLIYLVPLFWITTTLAAAYYLTFHQSYESYDKLSEPKVSLEISKKS
jgi:NSS family neurotransmitter:Na+ symporter